MPIGVPPFPKVMALDDAAIRLCDRAQTSGVAADCLDLADYSEKERRNQLQHSLLAIATDVCHAYKMRLYGWTRFGLFSGAVSHLTGAASAITGHKATSRTLVGIGTATGAIGGDFDSYFRQSRLSIALSGIELGRTRVFKQIAREQRKDIDQYPVAQAVNDALRYHQVCNLPEGLSESASAVESATREVRAD